MRVMSTRCWGWCRIMTREEYIESVVAQIEDKTARAEVAAEVAAHLDDRIAFYTDAGYDEEYALFHAIERMGDSAQYAQSLAKLHKSGNTLFNIYLNAVLALLYIAVYVVDAGQDYLFRATIMEIWVMLSICEGLAEAVKRKNKVVPVVMLVLQTVFAAVKLATVKIDFSTRVTSAFLLTAAQLVTDGVSGCAAMFFDTPRLTVSPLLVALSVVTYVAVFALIIGVLVYIRKHTLTRCSLAQRKKEKRFCAWFPTVTITAMCAVFAVVAASALFTANKYSEKDMLVIAESDSPCDFSKWVDADDEYMLKTEDGIIYYHYVPVRKDYDSIYPYRYPETGYDEIDAATRSYTETKKCGAVQYEIKHNVLTYTPQRPYAYVFAAEDYDSNGPDEYDASNWVRTDKAHSFEFAVEQTKHPINISHVVLNPKKQ